MSSGLSTPVGFKNATDGDLGAAVNGILSASHPHSFLGINDQGLAAIVRTKGNPHGHLVLRGGSGRPNYDTVSIALAEAALRKAGLPDPTEHLDHLPPLDDIDALFGREGLAREIRAAVTRGIIYSPASLRDHGFDLILRHITDGGNREGLWRTVARLCRIGEPIRALRLAATLARQ